MPSHVRVRDLRTALCLTPQVGRLVGVLAALLLAAMLAACTDSLPTAPERFSDHGSVNELDAQSSAAEQDLRRDMQRLLTQPAEITLEGSTIYYTGAINPVSAEHLLRVANGAETLVDTLVINSQGGGAMSGRRIGEWVHEHQIAVVVDTLCFSSCANYVFAAAPRKVIRADALVGWHGSDQQLRYIAESGGITLEELIDQIVDREVTRQEQERGRELVGEDRSRLRTSLRDSLTWLIEGSTVEQDFLDRIGVSVEALVYGLMPTNYARYQASGASGWTFSIEDMAKFGISNVTYEGRGEFPSEFTVPSHPVIVFDVAG